MIFKSSCEVLSLEVCKHSLMLLILDFVIHVSKEVMSSNCSVRVKGLIQGELSRWARFAITQLGILFVLLGFPLWFSW